MRILGRIGSFAAVVSILTLSNGCRKPAPIQARLLSKSDLTPAEIKYGRAPQRDSRVSYQSDVIIVDGGAESIRSLSPDGLTWTIDARARHANEIKVGKIAFVTGRCVGRVLWEKRESNDLALVLGPVELSDVYRRLEIDVSQPLDLTRAIEYPPPQLPVLESPVAPTKAAAMPWVTVPRGIGQLRWDQRGNDMLLLMPAALLQGAPPAPGVIPQNLDKIPWQTSPLSNADGIGMELRHDGSGVRLVAQMQLRLDTPKFDAHIGLGPGGSWLILRNGAGLKLAFDGAVNEQFSGNIQWQAAGGELVFPIGGPAPLSIDIRQQIWVETAFSARQSSFRAGGEYGFNADLGFTYRGGRFSVVGPKGFTVRKSLMQNMNNISLAPSGLVLTHVITITAGLGAAGFTTGPKFDIATSVGVAQGGNTANVQCRGATLTLNIRCGLGWTIPQVLATAGNFVLGVFGAHIPAQGGIPGAWFKMFAQQAQTESQVCGGPPSAATQASDGGPAPSSPPSGNRGGVMLGFGPGESSARVGQTFSMDVVFVGGGDASPVLAQVRYDPGKLQVVKVSTASRNVGNPPGTLIERHDTARGLMRAVVDRPAASRGSQNAVLTVTFLARSHGPAQVSVAGADLRGASDPALQSETQTVINIKNGKP